jgi:hypothetical protein
VIAAKRVSRTAVVLAAESVIIENGLASGVFTVIPFTSVVAM